MKSAKKSAASFPDPLLLAAGAAALGLIAYAAWRQRSVRPRPRPASLSSAAATPPSADATYVRVDDPERRGRAADAPVDLPLRGWREIGLRVFLQIRDDRLLAVAAGVTFYALLALFPALVALVSLYGLTADLGTLNEHLGNFAGIAPQGVLDFVGDQVTRIVTKSDGALGFAFLLASRPRSGARTPAPRRCSTR